MALKINNIDFPGLAEIAANYYNQEKAIVSLALKELEALNLESQDISYLIKNFKDLLNSDVFDKDYAAKENLTSLIKKSEYARLSKTFITSDGTSSAYLKVEDLLNIASKRLPRLPIFMDDDLACAKQILRELQEQHEALRKTYMLEFLSSVKNATVDKLLEFTTGYEDELSQVEQLNASKLARRTACLQAHKLVNKLKEDIDKKTNAEVCDLTETLSVVTKKYIDPFNKDPAEKDLWDKVTNFIRLTSVTIGTLFSILAIAMLITAIAFPLAIPVIGTALISCSIVAGVFSLTPAFVIIGEVCRNAYYGRGATQDQAKKIGVVLCGVAVCVGLGAHGLSALINPIGKAMVAISRMALTAVSNLFRFRKISKTEMPQNKPLAKESAPVAPQISVKPETTKPTKDEFFTRLDKNLFQHFAESEAGMLIAQPAKNALKAYLDLDKSAVYEIKKAKLTEFEAKIDQFEQKIDSNLLDDAKRNRLQEAKDFVSLEKLDLKKESIQNHYSEPEKEVQNQEFHAVEGES